MALTNEQMWERRNARIAERNTKIKNIVKQYVDLDADELDEVIYDLEEANVLTGGW
jgi:hypothetical protein